MKEIIVALIFALALSCECTWPMHKYESKNVQMRRQVFGNNHDLTPHNFHFQQMNSNVQVNNFQMPCNCVKLKYCNPIMEMARTMYSGFIATYINDQLQVHQCKVNSKGEMYVCCPNLYGFGQQYSHQYSHHASNPQNNNDYYSRNWNYDGGPEKSSSEEDNDNRYSQNRGHSQYVSYPIQGFYHHQSKTNQKQQKLMTFVVNHEDPHSHKNCPQALASSKEFSLPKNHTFFSENESEDLRIATTTATTTTATTTTATTTTTTSIPLSVASLPIELQSKMRLINQDECGRISSSRIIGGNDADEGRFLWIARLAYKNKTSGKISYRCAGSLISHKYVLTAGHCVSSLIDTIELSFVRLGEVDDSQVNECNGDGFCVKEEDFEIQRTIVHPNYNKPRYQFDIALLKLVQSTEASNSISPICLPIANYEHFNRDLPDEANKNGIIAGFGATSRESNAQSQRLQWISLPFVSTATCAAFYSNYSATLGTRILISNNQLCLQGESGKDACAGDSGGPLMNSSQDEKFVLLGIVSFGPQNCGLSNFPGVYTKVSSFMEWILQSMDE